MSKCTCPAPIQNLSKCLMCPKPIKPIKKGQIIFPVSNGKKFVGDCCSGKCAAKFKRVQCPGCGNPCKDTDKIVHPKTGKVSYLCESCSAHNKKVVDEVVNQKTYFNNEPDETGTQFLLSHPLTPKQIDVLLDDCNVDFTNENDINVEAKYMSDVEGRLKVWGYVEQGKKVDDEYVIAKGLLDILFSTYTKQAKEVGESYGGAGRLDDFFAWVESK